jgi:hypothetical protein
MANGDHIHSPPRVVYGVDYSMVADADSPAVIRVY